MLAQARQPGPAAASGSHDALGALAGFRSRAASADLSACDNTVVGAAMADAAMIFFMVGLSPGDVDIGRFG